MANPEGIQGLGSGILKAVLAYQAAKRAEQQFMLSLYLPFLFKKQAQKREISARVLLERERTRRESEERKFKGTQKALDRAAQVRVAEIRSRKDDGYDPPGGFAHPGSFFFDEKGNLQQVPGTYHKPSEVKGLTPFQQFKVRAGPLELRRGGIASRLLKNRRRLAAGVKPMVTESGMVLESVKVPMTPEEKQGLGLEIQSLTADSAKTEEAIQELMSQYNKGGASFGSELIDPDDPLGMGEMIKELRKKNPELFMGE